MQDSEEASIRPSSPRHILLFSDGTGNSSGKLNKTNVWRIYEATDFGWPCDKGSAVQIGRYDDGVGTSAFRPWALLQGVMGWGLSVNVRSLYLFLCRNYRPGDKVFLFGFSRGAFTVRALAALIDQKGIISSEHGDDLPTLAKRRFDDYHQNVPRMWPMRGVITAKNWMSSARSRLWSRITGKARGTPKINPGVIDFIGVWDTVSAYGGPFVELVRAFDLWITRISFTDEALPSCVKVARHALALDDERDSFAPILWEEKRKDSARLQQVWFAGMHSDVGGGYPEQGLAHVSLCWMMEHAAIAEVRFKSDRVRQALDSRDPFGRLHDSRSGAGGYYRYQPRNTGAYVEPPELASESAVTPDARGDLQAPVLIHESVLQRIASGTDGYAPISVAARYDVVEEDFTTLQPALLLPDNLSPDTVEKFRQAAASPEWQATRKQVRDLVWWRRIAYFSLVIASLGLAAMPFWPDWPTLIDSGLFRMLAIPFLALSAVLPDVFGLWFRQFSQRPIETWLLLAIIFAFFVTGGAIERSIQSRSRAIWLAAKTGARMPSHVRSRFRKMRESRSYQSVLEGMKWHVMPHTLGMTMVAILGVLLATLLTQARISMRNNPDLACRPATVLNGRAEWRFSTPCTSLRLTVEAGRTYRAMFAFRHDPPWPHLMRAGDPKGRIERRIPLVAGVPAFDFGAVGRGVITAGLRRDLEAAWLQPLLYVHQMEAGRATGRQAPPTLLATIKQWFRRQPRYDSWQPDDIVPLDLRYVGKDHERAFYTGTFQTRYSGPIGIGLNDAVALWPWSADRFYQSGAFRAKHAWSSLIDRGGCLQIWQVAGGPRDTAPALLHCAEIERWIGNRPKPGAGS